MNTIKIILADDHPVVLLGAQTCLQAKNNREFDIVGCANGVQSLLDTLAEQPCDLLITDYRMPDSGGPDGLALIAGLRRQYPAMPILVMSMLNSSDMLRTLMRSGVTGLFDKQCSLDKLPQAARLAARGKSYLSPGLEAALGWSTRYPINERQNYELTPRETEVVRLFTEGFSGRDMAARLNRSEKTISRHKRSAMDKLGIAHDSGLLDYARHAGLRG